MKTNINQDPTTVHILQQQVNEYERLLAEKNLYLSKLEMDLEHAITQCKKIAKANANQWINRQEPGLEGR